jgi:hypothetical protein
MIVIDTKTLMDKEIFVPIDLAEEVSTRELYRREALLAGVTGAPGGDVMRMLARECQDRIDTYIKQASRRA